MSERISMAAVAPEAYKTVRGLEKYIRARVDPTLLELVKLRASMLNGCAFCVDMHSTEALAAGEDVRRVVAAAAWRESTFFTGRERIALEVTDALTRLGEHGVPDDVWDPAVEEFGEQGLADLVVAIATINVWNRFAVATHMAAPPLRS